MYCSSPVLCTAWRSHHCCPCARLQDPEILELTGSEPLSLEEDWKIRWWIWVRSLHDLTCTYFLNLYFDVFTFLQSGSTITSPLWCERSTRCNRLGKIRRTCRHPISGSLENVEQKLYAAVHGKRFSQKRWGSFGNGNKNPSPLFLPDWHVWSILNWSSFRFFVYVFSFGRNNVKDAQSTAIYFNRFH